MEWSRLMDRLNVISKDKKSNKYCRNTAEKALNNVISKIYTVNKREDFIYKVTKAVLFGSYINSDKQKVGDLDIAIYIELKDNTISEYIQNQNRAKTSKKYVPLLLSFVYGKNEVFKFIRDNKKVVQIHDGYLVDNDAKKYNESLSYIYFDKYEIIYKDNK